jgi:hypothetical protein
MLTEATAAGAAMVDAKTKEINRTLPPGVEAKKSVSPR